MVNIPKRLRKLQVALTDIRLGPGAMILPKEVQRIEMSFATKMNGGHMGPRKFWRSELKRLKYHNPGVVMNVERTDAQEAPAVMSIFFDGAKPEAGSGFAQQTDAPTRVEKINMKNFTNSEILSALVALTKPTMVVPSPEDEELMRDLDEQRARSIEDSTLSLEVRKRAKREKELLEQAKGSLA